MRLNDFKFTLSLLKFYNIVSLICFPCFLLSKIFKSYYLPSSVMDTFPTQTPLHVKLSAFSVQCFYMLFVYDLCSCFISYIHEIERSDSEYSEILEREHSSKFIPCIFFLFYLNVGGDFYF